MHSCSFYNRSTRRSDGLHYLFLWLPARPFSGLLERRLLLPYSLYPPSGTVVICPLVFFCFTICIPNTLAFWKKTWGIRSVLGSSTFGFWCPLFSGGGSEVAANFISFFWRFPEGCWCLISVDSQPCPIWTFTWKTSSWGSFLGWLYPMSITQVVGKCFQSFPRKLNWIFSSACSIDHVGGLLSCRRVALLFCSSISGLLFLGSLRSSLKDWFALVSGVPGSLIPDFCSCHPLTKNFPKFRFPYLQRGFVMAC